MADTHVTVTGNLTDDPELRFTNRGTPVVNFRLAVTARVREGEVWKDGETSYFRVNVWRDQAEHAAESLAKGDRAVVIGRLRSRSWETPDGEKRSMVEIEADEVAVSLRWATARPERTNGKRTAGTAAAASTGPASPGSSSTTGGRAAKPRRKTTPKAASHAGDEATR